MDVAKIGTRCLRVRTAAVRRLKGLWFSKAFPYGMHYRDEVAGFDRLYRLRDPWSMNCERERFRFKETNRLILENFGRPHSLLEIGCGEGLQSSELQHVCDHLHGIDVSRRAVARAMRRCPQVTFSVGDIYSLPEPTPLTRFDLVTACEVLYYVADVAAALKRISELGRACMVGYYHGPHARLDERVREISGVQFEIASYEDVSWTFAWWRP